MDSRTVTDLARAGNSEAIAFLLNQWLKPYYVMATVSLEAAELHVHLKAAQPPLPELFVDLVVTQLQRLNLPFARVHLHGYALEDTHPAWSQELPLKTTALDESGTFSKWVQELEKTVSLSPSQPLPSLPGQMAQAVVQRPHLATSLPNYEGQRSVQNFFFSRLPTPKEKETERLQNILGVAGLVTLLLSVGVFAYNKVFPRSAISQAPQSSESPLAEGQATPPSETSPSPTATQAATPASPAAKTSPGSKATTRSPQAGTPRTNQKAGAAASKPASTGDSNAVEATVTRELDQLKEQFDTFKMMAQYEPTVYQQFQEQVKAAARDNTLTSEKAAALGRELGASIVGKYLPIASDRALLDFALTRFNLLKQASSKKPEICRSEIVTGEPIDLRQSIQQNFKELDDVVAAVIQTGATQPAPLKDVAVAQSRLQKVVADMGDRYGDDFLKAKDQKANIDPKKTCQMMNDFWALLLNLPDAEAASALRYLWASNSPKGPAKQ